MTIITKLKIELQKKDELIAELREQNAVLTRQVADLTERLNQNSGNSHLPPSSDGPGKSGPKKTRKNRSKKSGSQKRKRGGQPGHKGHHRKLVPAEEVDDFVEHFPPQCEGCWADLPQTTDANATRFQVTEVPPVTPHVTEHRIHSVLCTCGHTTRAKEEGVPNSAFGPRLMSLVALLTGVYHISRSRTVSLLDDMVGVTLSVGSVSNIEKRVSEALKPAVEEAWTVVDDAPVKHADATAWLKAGMTLSLWTLASAAATVYKIFSDGKRETIQSWFGQIKGILVSDRATVFGFWAMKHRQICFAHLIRKFVSFSERAGPAKKVGEELLDLTTLIFEYWHNYRDGIIDKEKFVSWMVNLRRDFERVLEGALALNIKGLSGSCGDILEHKEALWTFVDQDGIEPTNNHAERELRAFVLWRKRSFGNQSERGLRYAERMMTVAQTAKKQNIDVLQFLTDTCQAACDGNKAPSLFAVAA